MATKIPFRDYTPRTHGGRTIDEAISELQREMDVRKRLFDKWVAEGRIGWIDADDRMQRHLTALRLLIQYARELDAAQNESDNATDDGSAEDMPSPTPSQQNTSPFSLDQAAA